MKTQKLISIDEEIAHRLRNEPNASNLINSLLLSHYQEADLDNYTKEELLAEKEIIQLKKEFDKKAQEIRENARSERKSTQ